MGRIDKELAEREQLKQERREAEARRILREKKRCKSDTGEAEAGELSDSEERNDGMNNVSPDFLPKPSRQ